MDSSDELVLPEQFDSLLSNNFSEGDWTTQAEAELHEENLLIENLVFGESSNKTYSVIDEALTKDILFAFDKEKEVVVEKKEEDEDDIIESMIIQCANCSSVFTQESFQNHVCTHDDNGEPIFVEIIEEQPTETELEKIQRNALALLFENQSAIGNLLNGFNEINSSERQKKNEDKAKQSNYECIVCNRKFVHESGLYRHYDKHIGEIIKKAPNSSNDTIHPVVLCVFCGLTLTKEKDAWDHFTKVHLEVENGEDFIRFFSNEIQFDYNEAKAEPHNEPPRKRRKINILGKPQAKPEKIRVPARDFPINEFIRIIYVSKLFHCEFCDSAFANSKSLLYHSSNHEPSAHFSCHTCDLNGLSLKDILLHRHSECWNYRDFCNPYKDLPHVWICNVCDEEFLGLEDLTLHRHKSNHFFPRLEHRSNQLLFLCEICCNSFENANQLVDHLQDRHLKKTRQLVAPETSLRIQKSPKHHRKGGNHQTSTKPRQYLCHVCGKSYTQSSHLWQHLRFHQGVKPFVCPHEDCNRRFTIRPDLNDHIRKCHTGERPYECTVCGKRFLTGSVYYQHRLIHRGERRYGCEECGKRFYRADALKNHSRIHSGEKPYACHVDGCLKSFRQRGDRDKHVKARHKDAPPPIASPKRVKVKSFGRGRTKNNTSLYSAKPDLTIDGEEMI